MEQCDFQVSVGSLSETIDFDDRRVIILADLEEPFLLDIEADELETLKALTLKSPFAVWVSSCGITTGAVPENATTWGLTRALRSENSCQQYSIDIDPRYLEDWEGLGSIITLLFRKFEVTVDGDHEYALIDGVLHVNRILTDPKSNELSDARRLATKKKMKFSEAPSLSLDIQDVGLFDTFYFTHDSRVSEDLDPEQIEVRAEAFGMNMKVCIPNFPTL